MKKHFLAMVALTLALAVGGSARAQDNWTGFSNDSYGAQLSFDSFDNAVKKRLELTRLGGWSSGGLGFSAPIQSGDAYAITPSSRTSTYESARRRQLDCVYYSGFTIWGDVYQNWSRQKTRNNSDGYRFRTFGPAVGFDWSSNGFTIGLATTYNWGKLKGREISHDRKVHTWGLDGYIQYDTERLYGNLTIGYGYNRFTSDRVDLDDPITYSHRYHTNSFNVAGEFGYKFNFGAFKVVPHVGLRYFHDRRGHVDEDASNAGWDNFTVHTGRQNYHVLELPIGVNLGYEFITNGLAFMPQVRLGWTPELARRRGQASGVWGDGITPFHEDSPRRNRHGFNVGLGLEAKITRSLSASIDYDCKFRSGAYEHYWNLGVGFTF